MSVRFDASTDALSRTTNLPGTTFTYIGWVKVVNDGNQYHTLGAWGDSAALGFYTQWGLNFTGATAQFYFWDGNAETNANGAVVGTWYHMATIIRPSGTTGDDATVYVNGGATATLNVATISSSVSNEKLWVGNIPDTGGWLDGEVEALKIWSAELTLAEIVNEMRQQVPMRTANLWGWSPFTTRGTFVTNYAGNANNWTAGGTLTDGASGPGIPWVADLPRKIYIFSGTSNQTSTPTSAVATATAVDPQVNLVTAAQTSAVGTATAVDPQVNRVTAAQTSAVATATANNPSTGGTQTSTPGEAVATATAVDPQVNRVTAAQASAVGTATAVDPQVNRVTAAQTSAVATATAVDPQVNRVTAAQTSAVATATAVDPIPLGSQNTQPASAAASAVAGGQQVNLKTAAQTSATATATAIDPQLNRALAVLSAISTATAGGQQVNIRIFPLEASASASVSVPNVAWSQVSAPASAIASAVLGSFTFVLGTIAQSISWVEVFRDPQVLIEVHKPARVSVEVNNQRVVVVGARNS